MKYLLAVIVLFLAFNCWRTDLLIKDMAESRHREEVIGQTLKKFSYELDVLKKATIK